MNDEQFPSTAWDRLQANDVEYLIASYWRPVFYFLRARRYPLHLAEDLTQEFFSRFLTRDWLTRADPRRGRFRTFLLKILKRFLSDQKPDRVAQQQRFEQQVGSIHALLGDAERAYEPADDADPEAVFMRQYVGDVIRGVFEQLRRACEQEGRLAWYEVFVANHRGESETKPVRQQELADQFALTRDQVRYALEQARQRFATLLRETVCGQVESKSEVDQEIRELLSWLRR